MPVAVAVDVLTKAQKVAMAATAVVVAEALTRVEQILPAALTVEAPVYQAVLLELVVQILAVVVVAAMAAVVMLVMPAEQAVQVLWLFVIQILILLQPPQQDHQQSL
jgi:hypothetical protein